jgi:hypothetical protein
MCRLLLIRARLLAVPKKIANDGGLSHRGLGAILLSRHSHRKGVIRLYLRYQRPYITIAE